MRVLELTSQHAHFLAYDFGVRGHVRALESRPAVASRSVIMDVDLKRLSGTASATEKPRLDTLRFTVAPNSFFTIVHPS
jgi:hypothetical protein